MEEKVVTSIGIAAKAGEDILAAFGHNTAAAAVAEYSSLAPVFLSLFDTIKALFHHRQATAPATK